MGEPPELQRNRHWRMAVWALRTGYLALGVALVGLIMASSGATPWVLAAGVASWLAAAAVTLTGVFWARCQMAEPRPGYWSMRCMLIRDSVRARPVAGCDHGSGPGVFPPDDGDRSRQRRS